MLCLERRGCPCSESGACCKLKGLLKTPISRALLLAGACLLAIAPFFWWGSPSGHDFEFHMYSWMDVLSQWKQGIFYPRWAALAQWGYGEARFLFYPPASWTLGAALGAVLPWRIVPGAYCWLVLMLAGSSMYWLARQWLARPDALFAAVFYALNPYHLLIVYWRSAYAELLAASLLPLLLGWLLHINEPGSRPILWLSLTLALAWLTNVPAAIMIHYSAAALALLVVAITSANGMPITRIWRPLSRTALAMLLAAGLASFYLVPVVCEQHWVNLSQVMSPGVRPQDNFLFTTTADADHNRFNLLVSSVALAEIVVLIFAIWFSKKRKIRPRTAPSTNSEAVFLSGADLSATSTDSWPHLWTMLVAWGILSAVLMFSISDLLWQHLPEFRFVQLPFRWLLCMNAALAILLAMAARRWVSRLLASALLLAAVIVAGYRIQPPWWDTAPDINEMSDAIDDGTGYEGTDEYVPAGADPYELNKTLPLVTTGPGSAIESKILAWGATEKHFIVRAAEPQNLVARLFNYPAWLVIVNGKPTPTTKTDVTGLIVIPVAAGESDVQIHFARTIDRTVGDVISLISLVVFVIACVRARELKLRQPATSPAQLTSPAA
jgi:6-pyruvoyl-tetrahydropterin synthase related domain